MSNLADQIEGLAEEGVLQIFSDRDEPEVKTWKSVFPITSPQQFCTWMQRAAGDHDVAITLSKQKDGAVILDIFHGGQSERGNKHNDCFTFNLNKSTAKLENIVLKETSAGVTKNYLHKMTEILRKEEFDTLALSTCDIGGYAWAKYGFKPDSQKEWENLKFKIKSRLTKSGVRYDEKIYPLEESEKKILNSVLANGSDPENIWRLTDVLNREITQKNGHTITVGKALLIGQAWEGELTLDEADKGFQRFQAYATPERVNTLTGAAR